MDGSRQASTNAKEDLWRDLAWSCLPEQHMQSHLVRNTRFSAQVCDRCDCQRSSTLRSTGFVWPTC